MSLPRSNGRPDRLVVRGIKGFLEGQERVLELGDELVIGRSRRADLSTRGSPHFLRRRDQLDLLGSNPFRSVSRRHVLVRFAAPGVVEIRDLSRNGTYLDGERIEDASITDLHERRRILSLGSQERFFLELIRGE